MIPTRCEYKCMIQSMKESTKRVRRRGEQRDQRNMGQSRDETRKGETQRRHGTVRGEARREIRESRTKSVRTGWRRDVEQSTTMWEDGARLKGETQWSELALRRPSGDVVGNSESDRSVTEVEDRVPFPLSLSSSQFYSK